MKDKIKANFITRIHKEIVEGLHNSEDFDLSVPEGEFFAALKENMLCNYRLWHLEDDARMENVEDSFIAELKRKIDKQNQMRNDFVEEMDVALESILPQLSEEEKKLIPSNTETPGSAIDRMSIASLKIFHMAEEAARDDASEEHIQKSSSRLNLIKIQLSDLMAAFDLLVSDLFAKEKQLKIYRQFKMYNDPEFNPSLYGKN
ncbi:MAG: DUF4254 domain-containing protein [Elusimicrobia bacterium]|nr:DUF4254 domain-containing protein [Elusimicrobiota bacterium]